MGNRTWWWVSVVLLLVAALAGVGYYSYNAGVVHGIAESGKLAGSGTSPVFIGHRWGFGFFPFFPIFFIFLWIFLLRGLFWRGRGWLGGCGYGYGRDIPPHFEDWHRRAHEQGGTPASSGTSKP